MFSFFKKREPAQQPVDEIAQFQNAVRSALTKTAEDMGAVLLTNQDDVTRFLEWMANPERRDTQQ